MAATTNGLYFSSFRASTVALAIPAIPVIPRLPTPTAIVPPGRHAFADLAFEDQPANRPRHILHPGLGNRLPNARQGRKVHRHSAPATKGCGGVESHWYMTLTV